MLTLSDGGVNQIRRGGGGEKPMEMTGLGSEMRQATNKNKGARGRCGAVRRSGNVGKNRPGDQCHDDCTVFNIGTRLERVVRVIEDLRNMARNADRQD